MEPATDKGSCLLSLDGGGVRGLATLLILKRIMYVLEGKVGPDVERPLLPCKYFDMIAGTSTGGLIAIMLGVLKMDIDTCISSYRDLAPKIFPEEGFLSRRKFVKFYKGIKGIARFDATNLELAVKAMVASKMNTEDAVLENKEMACRTFVCVTNKNAGKPFRLRNYRSSWEPSTGCTVWQAARATSAAPLYFPSIQLGNPPANYVDGGLNYNNPVRALYDEAKHVWGKSSRKIKCIVSIGTGVMPLKAAGDTGKEIVESLVSIALDTQKIADEFADDMEHLKTQGEGLKYVRLNVSHGLESMKLEEWKDFDLLTGATNYYLNSHKGEVEQCADALLDVGEVDSRMLCEMPISSKDFFGRVSDIKKLAEIMHSEDPGQKAVVIWGLGGFGKSRLALQYINMYEARYSAILWVNAGTLEMAVHSFCRAALELKSRGSLLSSPSGGDKDIALIHRWLSRSQNENTWLLVIDSIDDLENFDCRRLVPSCNHGNIIVTSTNSQTSTHLGFQDLELGSIDENAGSDMLLNKLSSVEVHRDSKSVAKQIVKALDGVPLAIEQARAVLREGIPLDEFLKYYNSAYTELMSSKPARSAWYYDKNISFPNVFKMTLSRLEGNEDALNLLSLASCFGSRLLPVEYLTPAFDLSSVDAEESSLNDSNTQERLQLSIQRRGWLNTLRVNQLGFCFAVSRLEALCLLKVRRNLDGSAKYISVHDSVCRLRLETLENDSRGDWVMLAACVLAQHVPETGLETGPLLGLIPLVKHTTLLIKSSVSPKALEAPHGRLCHLYGFVAARFAYVYLEGASTKNAEEMLTAAISYEMVSQQSLWPKDQRSLTLLKSMGMIYWKLGKLEDAAEVFEYLHESSEEFPGPVNDMTVWAASRLRDVRERKIAFSNYEINAVRASNVSKLDSLSQTLPLNPTLPLTSEDPEIEISDSERSLIQHVEVRLEFLGEDNKETWTAMNDLAEYYRKSRSFAKAAAWFERLFHFCSLSSYPLGFVMDAYSREALFSAMDCYGSSVEISQKLKSFEGGLALAAGADRLDIVRKLLSAGADPNERDKAGFTALHKAAPRGDESMMSDLLSAGADPNYEDNSSRTPLYIAAGYDRFEAVKLLLHYGADPNIPEAQGVRPLSLAVVNDKHRIAKLLLEKGADPDFRFFDEQTYLANPEIAQFMLENRQIDILNDIDIEIYRGNPGMVKLMLENGADEDVVCLIGQTYLSWAAGNGRIGVLKTLLESGADVTVVDRYGRTPLHHAARQGRGDTVALLLRQVADLDRKESATSTRASKAWMSQICNRGTTALDEAMEKEHGEIVRTLIGYGALAEAANPCGLLDFSETANCLVQLAIFDGRESHAIKLIDDCKGPETATILNEALFVSVLVGATTSIENLISRGANLPAKTLTKQTPLHIAAYMGHASLVSTFIKCPIDIWALDVFGSGPPDLASANQNRSLDIWESASILLQHDALAEKRECLTNKRLRAALEGPWSGTRNRDFKVRVPHEVAFTIKLESTLIARDSSIWVSKGEDSIGDFEIYGHLFPNDKANLAQVYGTSRETLYFGKFDRWSRTIEGVWQGRRERESGSFILRKRAQLETIEEPIVR